MCMCRRKVQEEDAWSFQAWRKDIKEGQLARHPLLPAVFPDQERILSGRRRFSTWFTGMLHALVLRFGWDFENSFDNSSSAVIDIEGLKKWLRLRICEFTKVSQSVVGWKVNWSASVFEHGMLPFPLYMKVHKRSKFFVVRLGRCGPDCHLLQGGCFTMFTFSLDIQKHS